MVQTLKNVNLLVTSRPHLSLVFGNMKKLEVRATKEDLRKFLDAQMRTYGSRFNGIVDGKYPDGNLREHVISTIISCAGDM